MNPEGMSGFVPQSEVARSTESLPSNALRITKKIGGVIAEAYFAPKPWEKNGTIYRWLGVRTFKKFIPSGDLLIRKITGRNAPFLRRVSVDSAKRYEMMTRVNESIHAPIAAYAVGSTAYFIAEGNFIGAGITGGVGVVCGLYPTMLQRYNRARIYGLINRSKDLGKSSTSV